MNCKWQVRCGEYYGHTVFLKNRVQSSYAIVGDTARPDQRPIHPSDRAALKNALPQLLSSSSSRNLTVQLGATLKAVISDDFPEKWPELVSISKQLLSSSNIHEVVAGSIIVLEMVRAFR